MHAVSADDTARALGSGDLDVLATPRLLAWCEAGHRAALDRSPRRRRDLGRHPGRARPPARPAPSARSVTVRADLVHVDGRLLRFDVVAEDSDGVWSGTATVTRLVVDTGTVPCPPLTPPHRVRAARRVGDQVRPRAAATSPAPGYGRSPSARRAGAPRAITGQACSARSPVQPSARARSTHHAASVRHRRRGRGPPGRRPASGTPPRRAGTPRPTACRPGSTSRCRAGCRRSSSTRDGQLGVPRPGRRRRAGASRSRPRRHGGSRRPCRRLHGQRPDGGQLGGVGRVDGSQDHAAQPRTPAGLPAARPVSGAGRTGRTAARVGPGAVAERCVDRAVVPEDPDTGDERRRGRGAARRSRNVVMAVIMRPSRSRHQWQD